MLKAAKQYAPILFPPLKLMGLRMDLNVPKSSFLLVSEFMARRGAAYTTGTDLRFVGPLSSHDHFTDTCEKLVKPLGLEPPVSVPELPTSGRSWPLQSWAHYIHSRPSLVDTIHWKRSLTFLLRGDAYLCAGGSWF